MLLSWAIKKKNSGGKVSHCCHLVDKT